MMFWIFSSCAALLLVMGLRRLLRGRISPGLQYALWLFVLLRLLIPGTLASSAFSAANLTEHTQLSQDLERLRGIHALRHVDNGPALGYPSADYTGDSPVVISEYATPERFARLSHTLGLRDVLRTVWLVGVCVTGGVLLGCNLSFARRLWRSRKKVDINSSLLPVYLTEGLKTPCLFGLLHPSVYITTDVALSETKLRHVLTHEETHYLHGDMLWAALRGIALALHWYNPLVWYALALSRRDAETACDAGTIRRLGERERAEYGRTLIGLTVKKTGGFDLLCCATTMTGGKKAIQERIAMIVKNPKTKRLSLVAVIAAAAVAVVCLFTGAAEGTRSEDSDSHAYVLHFDALGPGETVYSQDVLYFTAGGTVSYRIGWEPKSAPVEFGIETEDGAYLSTGWSDGAGETVFPAVPPGTYRAFVRNVSQTETITGSISFDYAVTGVNTDLPDRGEPPFSDTVQERNAGDDNDLIGAATQGNPNRDGTEAQMERKDNDCEAFLSRIQQEDWDWRAAWETDPEGVLALISSLTDYVTDHALNDESLLALLRCTRGLDGAYGEGYAGLLNILWQRDQERYLRLWEMLTEEEQNRAIPPDVLAAVNFAGTDAARGWMRSTTG